MSDFAAGMGQGFSRLGDLFFGILQQRSQAGFEDQQNQKRLEAANRAQLELQKQLDAYRATQVAQSRPFLGPADEGPPQPMMQDVNSSGAAIGAPKAMRPDERFAFDASTQANQQKAYKEQLGVLKTEADIENLRAAQSLKGSQEKYYNERDRGGRKDKIASPKSWKSEDYAKSKLEELGTVMEKPMHDLLKAEEAELLKTWPVEYEEEVLAYKLKEIYDKYKALNDDKFRDLRLKKMYGDGYVPGGGTNEKPVFKKDN